MNKFYTDIFKYLQDKTKIGIFVSGGFDSTTLLYLICKIINDENCKIILKLFIVPRFDDSVSHVERVSKWIKKIFPNLIIEIEYLGNPNLHHSQQVISGIKEAINKYPDLLIFLADTGIPPELDTPNAPKRIKSTNKLVVQPFFDYDKITTLQLAKDLNKLNEISIISHTCTESKLLRCNNCWQCNERAWAFKKLNLIDIGNM